MYSVVFGGKRARCVRGADVPGHLHPHRPLGARLEEHGGHRRRSRPVSPAMPLRSRRCPRVRSLWRGVRDYVTGWRIVFSSCCTQHARTMFVRIVGEGCGTSPAGQWSNQRGGMYGSWLGGEGCWYRRWGRTQFRSFASRRYVVVRIQARAQHPVGMRRLGTPPSAHVLGEDGRQARESNRRGRVACYPIAILPVGICWIRGKFGKMSTRVAGLCRNPPDI